MLLAELATACRNDPFEEVARRLEAPLGRNRPGKVVDCPERLEAYVTIETAHAAHDALLKPPCLGEFALSGHRDGQFADCFECVEVVLAKLKTAGGDHSSLELARRDQPTLCPKAIGEVEHRCKRLWMLLAQRTAPLLQQTLLVFATL